MDNKTKNFTTNTNHKSGFNISTKFSREGLAISTAILTGILRLFPLIPNFSPVGALSIFSGAKLKGYKKLLIPILLLIITNYLLHLIYAYPFFNFAILFVLVSFSINVFLGHLLLKKEGAMRVGLVALLASLQFFVITNLGVFFSVAAYPKNIAGLVACYTAALPFFRWTLLGDVIFSVLLFSVHHLIENKVFAQKSFHKNSFNKNISSAA